MTSGARRSVAVVYARDEPQGDALAARLRDLLEHGWDAHILCEAGDSLLGITSQPSVVTRALRARRPRAAARALLTARHPRDRYLRAVLLALEPALLHFPSVRAARRYAGVVKALEGRVVVGVRGDEADALALDDPEQLYSVVAWADGVHVESEAAAEALQSRGLPKRVVTVIPAAREYRLPRPADDTLRILSIGPLEWTQGYEYALHAVALLADRGIPCRYRIVGRGAFADAVGFARHELGIERLVEIVDPRDRSMLHWQLHWADALVSAAVVPGRLPHDALEHARAARVTVVATEPQAAAVTTIVVPRRDAEALAQSLARLAANPELRRRRAGATALDNTIPPYERLARFRDLYERALDARPRTRV